MTADYAALEARLAELEQQIRRHVLSAKVDAMSEDTRYLREQSDIHGAALERLETRLDPHRELLGSINARLDRQGELPEDILQRLPPKALEAI